MLSNRNPDFGGVFHDQEYGNTKAESFSNIAGSSKTATIRVSFVVNNGNHCQHPMDSAGRFFPLNMQGSQAAGSQRSNAYDSRFTVVHHRHA